MLQGAGAFANLSTFRLSGFPTCWKVGKLAGWCGGGTAGGGGERARVFGLPRGKTSGRSGECRVGGLAALAGLPGGVRRGRGGERGGRRASEVRGKRKGCGRAQGGGVMNRNDTAARGEGGELQGIGERAQRVG